MKYVDLTLYLGQRLRLGDNTKVPGRVFGRAEITPHVYLDPGPFSFHLTFHFSFYCSPSCHSVISLENNTFPKMWEREITPSHTRSETMYLSLSLPRWYAWWLTFKMCLICARLCAVCNTNLLQNYEEGSITIPNLLFIVIFWQYWVLNLGLSAW
jgi:hypothetical protein